MPTLHLPPQLRARLNDLPQGLQAHVERVRAIARELAEAHGVDPDLAELTAAAHDVARAVPPKRLLEEAGRLGLRANSVETHAPILLRGPVGSRLSTTLSPRVGFVDVAFESNPRTDRSHQKRSVGTGYAQRV